jgi:prepilin-type N-terminal cleavage/methylation domain-containing protein
MGEQQHNRGFTIVELLIVIVVIAILAAITLVAYNGIRTRGTEASLRSDLRNAVGQLEADAATGNSYPSSQESANGGRGLPKSNGNSYQYSYDAATNTYCMTITNQGVANTSFYASSVTKTIQAGACTGHSTVAFDQPQTCPSGYVPVPGNTQFGTQGGFCVMKYEAKDVGGNAVSQAAGLPVANVSYDTVVAAIGSSQQQSAHPGSKIMTRNERLTIAHNLLSVASNWSGGAVGNGYVYSGHNDGSPNNSLAASANDSDGYFGTGNTSGNQRRTLTLTNGYVLWDFAGNVSEMTQETIAGNQQPGTTADTAYTCREYTQSTLQYRTLTAIRPAFGTPAASGWTAPAQGIGQLCSHYNDTATRVLRWGGPYNSAVTAGLFALGFFNAPNEFVADTGVRLTR